MSFILLVEDDADVRLLMEHVLFDEGHRVDTATTVDAACSLIDRRRYDLVVADGRLPDGTGMMVGDKAQERGIPALIITGYAFVLPREELGRFDVLLKPVRPQELVRAIGRALHPSGE
jgi:DNA-binding NtrC family response regulator